MAQHFAMAFAMLLIFNHLARPFELTLSGLRIPAVICGFAIIACLFGGALRGLTSSVGLWLVALSAWMAIAAPFGINPKGSLMYVLRMDRLMVVFFLLIAAASCNLKHVKRLAATVAASCVFHLLLARTIEGSDRLAFEGTFGNSDDVALMAGFAIPFCVLVALYIKNRVLSILTMLSSCLFLLRIMGLSGTRTGIVGLAVMMFVLALRVRMQARIGIAVAGLAAVSLIAVTLPSETFQRLATITKSFQTEVTVENDIEAEAIGSSMERRQLWQDAMSAISGNPWFGVGANNFANYRFDILRHHFLASHNTYLQIAAENGIPATLIYIGMLISIYRLALRSRKLNAPDSHADWLLGRRLALCLEVTTAFFIVCAVFLTLDRHPEVFVLAGMAVSLEKVTQRELARQAAHEQAAGASTAAVPARYAPPALRPAARAYVAP